MTTNHNITKNQAKTLYRTLKHLNDILIDNNISYWVTGGTLIGALRHRGIVPWDDDGDICIMRKDIKKFRTKVVPKLEKLGYFVEEGLLDDDGNKNSCALDKKKNTCTWFVEHNSKHSLGVDIFVMERVGPLVTYSDPGWRTADNGGKTCFFIYKYIFPLVPVRFGNFWVMTPHNAVDHLNQCYGTDWVSVSQRLYDHRSGKWINSKKKRMLVNDYGTIPAPSDTCQLQPPRIKKCMSSARPSRRVSNLTSHELKLISRLYNIKGRTRMSESELRSQIKKIV